MGTDWLWELYKIFFEVCKLTHSTRNSGVADGIGVRYPLHFQGPSFNSSLPVSFIHFPDIIGSHGGFGWWSAARHTWVQVEWYRNPTKQLEEKPLTVMELTIGPIGTSTMDICGILIEHDGRGTELPRICAGADENSQREMPEVYQVGKLDMARKSCFEIWPWSWGSSGISGKAWIHAHPIISHDLTLVVDPTREVNPNKQLGLWCPCVLMTFVLTELRQASWVLIELVNF